MEGFGRKVVAHGGPRLHVERRTGITGLGRSLGDQRLQHIEIEPCTADDAFAHGLKTEDIEQVMEENRVTLNTMLPAYSQISKMKIYPEEFEKTPKKSIKRYLYQEAKG